MNKSLKGEKKMSKIKKNILLVDDDVDYLFQKKLELEKEGFQVFTAHSIKPARKILEEMSIDLAIVDLMMQEKDDGFVLSYQIKSNWPKTPVIMVTGVTAQTGLEFDTITENEKKWIKADTIFTKPVRSEQLVREIRRLLAHE